MLATLSLEPSPLMRTTLTFNVFGSNNGGETFAQTSPDATVGQAQINAIQLRNITDAGGGTDFVLGDTNGDGMVSFLDIGPFVGILTSSGFEAEADIDGNLVVDFLDIGPFVDLLTGG